MEIFEDLIPRKEEKEGLFDDLLPRGNALDAVIEPARTMATGINRTITAGYKGMGAAIMPGGQTGVEALESETSKIYQPQTEMGQAGLEKVGDLVNFGIDVMNMPISALYGMAEFAGSMASGQGVDKSLANQARVQGQVQEDGFSQTVGNDVFEATGSPLAATAAQVAPEGMLEVLGLKGAGGPARAATQSVRNTGRAVAEFERPSVREIGRQIDEGGVPATRNATAGWRNELLPGDPLRIEGPEGVVGAGGLPAVIDGGETLVDGAPDFTRNGRKYRTVKDPAQRAAVKQGWDEGMIAMVRESSDIDRANMLESLDIMEESLGNTAFSMTARSTDRVGKSAMERYKVVKKENKSAGEAIDREAAKLKSEYVRFDEPVQTFLDELEGMGITINPDWTVNFKGSDIAGSTGAENLISKVVERMAGRNNLSAYEIHKLKRFIDEQVAYGKVGEGLTGRAERIVKNLRHDMDGILDNNFPDYDMANVTYAESIQAIEDFQKAVGPSIKLGARRADSAVGTAIRGVDSNIKSRNNLINALEDLQTLSAKYGLEIDDNVLYQAKFATEMDRMWGTRASTGFQGSIDAAIQNAPQSPTLLGAGMAGGKYAADKILGVTQERQIKAMRDLLNSFK